MYFYSVHTGILLERTEPRGYLKYCLPVVYINKVLISITVVVAPSQGADRFSVMLIISTEC